MKVNSTTLLFEDIDEIDILVLNDVENLIRIGNIPFDHPYVAKWFEAFGVDKDRLLVGSTVLHIRILQSIIDWIFVNGWGSC